MPLRFDCPSCGVRVKVPDGSEGRKVRCPGCRQMQRVPGEGGSSRARKGGAAPSSRARAAAALDDAGLSEGVEALAKVKIEDEVIIEAVLASSSVTASMGEADDAAGSGTVSGAAVASAESSEAGGSTGEYEAYERVEVAPDDKEDDDATASGVDEGVAPAAMSPVAGGPDAASLAADAVETETADERTTRASTAGAGPGAAAGSPTVAGGRSFAAARAGAAAARAQERQPAPIASAPPADGVPIARPRRKVAVRRRAPAPAADDRPPARLLIVLGWLMRIVAALAVPALVKITLIWKDTHGPSTTDLLFAMPVGIALVLLLWTVGEVALHVGRRR